jgi:membrane protein required for colicin V production
MPLVDLVLVIIVGAFVLFGLFFGFVHTLGSLVGSVLGIVLATRLLEPAVDKFSFFFNNNESVASVVIFIILFVLISKLIGLVFWILGKVFGILSWIPFAKTINRLLGAVLGFMEGVIVVGVIIYFALKFLPDSTVSAWLNDSSVANYLLAVMSALQALFPESLRIT